MPQLGARCSSSFASVARMSNPETLCPCCEGDRIKVCDGCAAEAASCVTMVYCQGSVEGFHCWPDAPEEVSHLRLRHRHMFGFKVEIKVSHDDRDVEFIIAKRAVLSYLKANPIRGSESCEMIAKRIRGHLVTTRDWNVAMVDVDEDGENGAIVRWE